MAGQKNRNQSQKVFDFLLAGLSWRGVYCLFDYFILYFKLFIENIYVQYFFFFDDSLQVVV